MTGSCSIETRAYHILRPMTTIFLFDFKSYTEFRIFAHQPNFNRYITQTLLCFLGIKKKEKQSGWRIIIELQNIRHVQSNSYFSGNPQSNFKLKSKFRF